MRLVGACRRVGDRRQLAQHHRERPARLRPELGFGPRVSDSAHQRLRHRHHRLALAAPGDPHYGLPELKHLPGLGIGLGHHPGRVGPQRRIGESVLRQLDAALRLQELRAQRLDIDGPRVAGLVADPALLLQRGHPGEVDLALLQRDLRRRPRRLRRLELQPQVGVVERRHHVAGLDPGADLGRPRQKLAADPEAEVGLGPGADRPGQPVHRRGTVQPDGRHHHHLRRRRDHGRLRRRRHRGEPGPHLGCGHRRGHRHADSGYCKCDCAASAHVRPPGSRVISR